MKVYVDNMIASAVVRGDLAEPSEMEALRLLRTPAYTTQLEIVTSRESWREQERTQDPQVRAQLQDTRSGVPVVSDDHRVLGFNTIDYGYRGFIASPLVTDIVDERTFAKLKDLGLKNTDARHVMYALHNGCVRFVTTDPHFLTRRNAIEGAYPAIHIVKPSELLREVAGAS